MNSLPIYSISILCLTLLFSCEDQQKEMKTEAKTKIPKALQEDKLEI
jgi:hypothetical protein